MDETDLAAMAADRHNKEQLSVQHILEMNDADFDAAAAASFSV